YLHFSSNLSRLLLLLFFFPLLNMQKIAFFKILQNMENGRTHMSGIYGVKYDFLYTPLT
ncbi:hypothetical protein ACJX0J_023173, partial [Zea mays]